MDDKLNVMLDKKSINIISKSIIADFDDGQTIFLDRERVTLYELNELVIGNFNVVNIPKQSYDVEIPNYYCSFYESKKSSTGYVAMFINKNREIYKTKNVNRINYNKD